MPTTAIEGLATRYQVIGTGPPLLMYAPGGFDAALEKWSSLGVYARTKMLDHLRTEFSCIVFDRRECGQSGGRVERLTWAHFAAQGKGLLDHLGVARAHIMGGCMGCCSVMAFGVAYPEATLSMVLYWPVGGAKYRLATHQRFAEHLAFVQQQGLREVVKLVQRDGKPFGPTRAAGPGLRSSAMTARSRKPMRARMSTVTGFSSPGWRAPYSTATPRRVPSLRT